MNAAHQALLPECDWCHLPCDPPDTAIVRDDGAGDDLTFCTESCEAAHDNG